MGDTSNSNFVDMLSNLNPPEYSQGSLIDMRMYWAAAVRDPRLGARHFRQKAAFLFHLHQCAMKTLRLCRPSE